MTSDDASDDPAEVERLPDKFKASKLAEKVRKDIEYWYGFDTEACEIARSSGQGRMICALLFKIEDGKPL